MNFDFLTYFFIAIVVIPTLIGLYSLLDVDIRWVKTDRDVDLFFTTDVLKEKIGYFGIDEHELLSYIYNEIKRKIPFKVTSKKLTIYYSQKVIILDLLFQNFNEMAHVLIVNDYPITLFNHNPTLSRLLRGYLPYLTNRYIKSALNVNDSTRDFLTCLMDPTATSMDVLWPVNIQAVTAHMYTRHSVYKDAAKTHYFNVLLSCDTHPTLKES